MHKKLLKSVAIVGLTSTALGIAQPVGAVVSGKYQNLLDEYNKKMNDLSHYSIGFSHALNQTSNITNLLDLASRLSNKEEFSHKKYAESLEILREAVFKVEGFLLSIELTKEELDWTKEQKKSSGYDQTPVIRLSKISYKQYNHLRDTLKKALKEFGKSVALIQKQNPELITLPLYFSKNINTLKFQGREENEYYDSFFYDYLYDPLKNELSDLINSNKTEYFNKLGELSYLMEQVEKILSEQRVDKEELYTYYSIALGDKNKDNKIFLSEKLPNIYSVKEKIEDLRSILFDYYKKIDDKVNQEKYKTYSEEFKANLENITEKNRNNNTQTYSPKDEEDENKDKKLMIVGPKQEVKSPVLTENIQSIPMTILQPSPTEIITVTFTQKLNINNPNLRGTTGLSGHTALKTSVLSKAYNINNLPEMSGERPLPYTEVTSRSNTASLAGTEDYHSVIVLKNQGSKTLETSDSTQTSQSYDKSGESNITKVTYNTPEIQVTEETSTPKIQEALEGHQASVLSQDESKNQNSLGDYTKSQINFWISDFNTTTNNLTSNQMASEKLEGLISRGKGLRNKLDNALGENKYSNQLKRDLDQLEMISNSISRMTVLNNPTVAQ